MLGDSGVGRPKAACVCPELMMESRDAADRVEAIDAADPIDRTEAADPIEAIESTDPTEPTDNTDPRQPMHKSESSDQSDHLEAIGYALMRATGTEMSYC